MERARAIILAAGKGSRLRCEQDEIPKALRLVNGKYLIQYILDAIDFIAPDDITIVVGVMGEKIIAALGDQYHYCWQREQNGTAHATLCARQTAGGFPGPVLVLYCDMPLLSRDTYQRMLREHQETRSKDTLLASRIHPIPAFGRLIRDEQGELTDIVEQSACTEEQKKIDEVNVGIQVLSGDVMWDCLEKVQNDNPKHEYYLTGLVKVMHALGYRQHAVMMENSPEFMGVNTMEELRAVEEILRNR